jgi:hypothetical protein
MYSRSGSAAWASNVASSRNLSEAGSVMPGRTASTRSRSAGGHQAHVAHQHVEELGQLVEPVGAQHAPHARDARVGAHGELQPETLGVDRHGAKLVDAKDLAVSTHAHLAEEDGPVRVEADTCGHHQHRQAEDQQACKGSQDVEQSLGHAGF